VVVTEADPGGSRPLTPNPVRKAGNEREVIFRAERPRQKTVGSYGCVVRGRSPATQPLSSL